MTEPASGYISLDTRRRLRTQAWRVWIITSLVVLVWVGSIVAAPLLGLSSVYSFFSYICHQMPDRSLHIDGHSLAVCTRCFGVYSGLLAGVLIYPVWRPIEEVEPIRRFWLFLSLIPVTIDWSLTMFGIWENTHLSRFVTGMILGVACSTFIVPALVEITRNFTARKPQTQ
jgi:uncharacterized membrane protein